MDTLLQLCGPPELFMPDVLSKLIHGKMINLINNNFMVVLGLFFHHYDRSTRALLLKTGGKKKKKVEWNTVEPFSFYCSGMLCSVRQASNWLFSSKYELFNYACCCSKTCFKSFKSKTGFKFTTFYYFLLFGFSWLKLKISLSMLCKLFALILGKRAVLCGH